MVQLLTSKEEAVQRPGETVFTLRTWTLNMDNWTQMKKLMEYLSGTGLYENINNCQKRF